jgi:hypothetical protein
MKKKQKNAKTLIIPPKQYYDSLIFEESNSKLIYANDFIELLLDIALEIQYSTNEQQKEKVS